MSSGRSVVAAVCTCALLAAAVTAYGDPAAQLRYYGGRGGDSPGADAARGRYGSAYWNYRSGAGYGGGNAYHRFNGGRASGGGYPSPPSNPSELTPAERNEQLSRWRSFQNKVSRYPPGHAGDGGTAGRRSEMGGMNILSGIFNSPLRTPAPPQEQQQQDDGYESGSGSGSGDSASGSGSGEYGSGNDYGDANTQNNAAASSGSGSGSDYGSGSGSGSGDAPYVVPTLPPAPATPAPIPDSWRRASKAERRRVKQLGRALAAWRAVQQEKYYEPKRGAMYAYDDAAAAHDPKVKIIIVDPEFPHGRPARNDKKNKVGSGGKKGGSNDDAAEDDSTTPIVTFTAACSADSSRLCDESDPFLAATCLQLNRAKLSPLCADYHGGKMACFLDVTNKHLCRAGESTFACLERNQNSTGLGRPCSTSKFMRYLRSPVRQAEIAAAARAAKLAKEAAANTTTVAAIATSATNGTAPRSTQKPTPAPTTTTAAPPKLPSFVQACGADAKKLCGTGNPFLATKCFEEHRGDLSPLCAEYAEGKAACYRDVSVARLCDGQLDKSGKPLNPFACLDANRNASSLSKACATSKFMQYVRSRSPVDQASQLSTSAAGVKVTASNATTAPATRQPSAAPLAGTKAPLTSKATSALAKDAVQKNGNATRASAGNITSTSRKG